MLLASDKSFKPFVKDWESLANDGNLLVQGENKQVFIGSDQFKNNVLILKLQF